MKRVKFFSIFFVLVLMCNMAIADNIGFPPGFFYGQGFSQEPYDITSQAWYTKLIDLTGYKGSSVEGTLHFELVPDSSASGDETYTLDFPGKYGNNFKALVRAVKHPGFEKFNYDIPFSSSDFVDEKFNRLCRTVSSDFGFEYFTDPPPKMASFSNNRSTQTRSIRQQSNDPLDFFRRKPYNKENMLKYVELFNHAFLYEWGTAVEDIRMIFSQEKPWGEAVPGSVYRVGKVTPSMFPNTDKYNEFINEMNTDGLWINWPGDSETQVAGWEFKKENRDKLSDSYFTDPNMPFKKLNNNMLLSQIPEFRRGTFNLFKYSYSQGSAKGADLVAITRPIAISKTYDKDGNIKSIEKPLFPSLSQLEFKNMNIAGARKLIDSDVHFNPPSDIAIPIEYHIFRYVLKEKPATGIDLKLSNDEVIVDFIYHNENPTLRSMDPCYINVYKSRKEADAYRYRIPKTKKAKPTEDPEIQLIYDRCLDIEMPNEITDSVQIVNKYMPSIYPSTGDYENVWVYVLLLILSIAMLVFIRRKRIFNK